MSRPVTIRNGPSFSRAEKLRVRALYLGKGRGPSEIAQTMGKEPRQITNLVNRLGWARKRAEVEARAESEAESEGLESARAFVESVAMRSEALVEKGFDLAENTSDAKTFAFAASGTKTFVGLVRQARSLDALGAVGGPSLTVIFGNPVAPAESEERRVSEVGPEQSQALPSSSPDLDFSD